MRTFLISLLLLATMTTVLSAEQPTPAPSAPQPATVGDTQLFQVVLIQASRKGTDDLDDLPKSAAKALADVRDFLPFKRYRLLDSAIVRMSYAMGGSVAMAAYEVKFSYERKNEKLSIWWFTVLPEKAKIESQATTPEAVKPLISTSFSMDRGETVVVGSSKIDGDDALLVLLTALPGR